MVVLYGFGTIQDADVLKQELKQIINDIKNLYPKNAGGQYVQMRKGACWECIGFVGHHGNPIVECENCNIHLHVKCMKPEMTINYCDKIESDFGRFLCWSCKTLIDCEENTPASLWKEINSS